MTAQQTRIASTKPPYDNTALRERIGNIEIATLSVDELQTAARDAAGTEAVTRSRWSWRRASR